MSVIEEKLIDAKSKLESDKVKSRKDGVKLLFMLLDGEQALQLLDSETARLWPDEQCKKVTSWPRVIRFFIEFTERELLLGGAGAGTAGSKSRSRGARGGGGGGSSASASARQPSEAANLLRRLVAIADDAQRSGRRGNLQLWVWRLWHHVAKMLDEPGLLQSELAAPYLALLSRHLLAAPEYTRHLDPVTAHTLLMAICAATEALATTHAQCESATAGVTAQLQSFLGVLTSLMGVWPGDVLEDQRQAVQAALEASARWLAKLRDTGKSALSWFGCALQLLAAGGLDALGVLPPQLHTAVRPLMRLAWRDDRTPRLKETMTRYCLLQLQLGALDLASSGDDGASTAAGGSGSGGSGSGGRRGGLEALVEVYDMALRDVQDDAVKWELDPEDGSIDAQALVRLQLLAAVFYAVQQAHSAGRLRPEQLTHGSGAHGGGDGKSASMALVIPDSDDDGDGDDERADGFGGRRHAARPPPAKRRRQLPPLEWLLEQCSMSPSRWAPVLAALLHHHGYHLPPSFHGAALQQILACLRPLLPYAAGAVSGGSTSAALAGASASGAAAAAAAAAATALLRPEDLAAKQLGAIWCLRCLEVLAQQHVYPASQTHGSRFFGCGFTASAAGSGGSSWASPSAGGSPASPSGCDAAAAAAATAAAWQSAADFLVVRVAGRNLLVPPTPGLPNALQAEALWALAAVLQVRRSGGVAAASSYPYVVRPPPGLLHTVVAVMQSSVPGDDTNAAAADGGAIRTASVSAGAGATGPAARSYIWQAAATTVVAALNAAPAADSSAVAACQAAAASCQSAVLRLAITPPNALMHALLGATSGVTSYTPVYEMPGEAGASRGRTASPPPLPALPLDLAPEQHPHPYTRLPRWCPNDSETTSFCCNVLAVQCRAVELMAWQEARERAFRYMTHGSAPADAAAAPAAGAEALAAGRRLMGRIAAAALSRVRNAVLDMADSGGAEEADLARLIGCGQLLLSATLHANALRGLADVQPGGGGSDSGGGGGSAGLSQQPHLQSQRRGAAGDGDPGITPSHAWDVLAKAVAAAVRPAMGEGGGGGGSGGGSGGGAAAAMAAGQRAGGDGQGLQFALEQLLKGMKALQDLLDWQRPAGPTGLSQQPLSQPSPPASSLAPALASLEAALQRQVAALRKVAEPTAGGAAGGGGSAGGGAIAVGWQGDGGHGGDDDDDEDFGGRRRGVARGRLGVGGTAGTAGSGGIAVVSAGGAGAAVGGPTQLGGGGAAATQMLTGPGLPTVTSVGRSTQEVALAGALRIAELLEAFAPLCGSAVAQVASRALAVLMQRRQQQPQQQQQPSDRQAGRSGGGSSGAIDLMEVDEDEIEEADDESDASGGSGGAYGSGRSAAGGGRRATQLGAPAPPEELVAALGKVVVSAAIAAGTAAAAATSTGGPSSYEAAAMDRQEVVVGSAASAGSANGDGGGDAAAARNALAAALAALGPDAGLLSLRLVKYEEPRATASGQLSYKVRCREVSEQQMIAVALQLRRLARHLGTTAANRGPAAGDSGGGGGAAAAVGDGAANAAGLDELIAAGGLQVLRDALQAIDEAFNTNDFVPYSWRLRAAVAALTTELLPLDTPRFSPGMPQYDMSDLVGSLRLLPCWQEPSYRARRTGATLTRILFRRFTAHDRLLEELDLPQLAGDAAERAAAAAAAAAAPPPTAKTMARSLTETAALSYVELLQLSSKLEVVVARRMLVHSALCKRDEGLVAAGLRLAAARLGYRAPADYLANIMRLLAWSWFTLYDMDTLLGASPILVDGTPAADPWVCDAATADPRVVFLRRNQGSVLLPLVMGDLQEPAATMSALLGLQLPALLSEHVPYIFGTLLLLQAAGQGRWLDEVARNGLVSSNLDVEGDVDRQLSNRTHLFLANMLLNVVPAEEAAARPDGVGSAPGDELPSLPTFSAETCCRAVLDIPGLSTPAENEAFLWTSLMTPHIIAWAAAALHEALADGSGADGSGGRRSSPGEAEGDGPARPAAAAPRHRAWRLAGLGALLKLLGPRAAEPATGRYLAHILMQQLREPALQLAVCALLHGLLGTMGLGPVPATHGSAAAAAPPLLEQAPLEPLVPEADRLAVLEELLPLLVSALAEALEAGAAVASVPVGFGLPPAWADDGSAVAAMDPCLQSYSDATEYSPVTGLNERTAVVRAGRPALVGLLLRVTLGSPPEVAAGLATCRLLPELPELREAVERQQRLRSRVSLPEQLAHLAAVLRRGARGSSSGGLGRGARARLVAAVRSDVEARWSELLVQDDEGAAAGGGACRGELLPAAAASAWELAAAAAELDDPGLSDLAARLLAAAGLRDPRVPPPPPGLTAEGSELPGSNRGRFASSAPVTQLTAPSVGTAAVTTTGRASRRTAAAAMAAPTAATSNGGGGRRSSRRSGAVAAEGSGAAQSGAAATAADGGGGGGTAGSCTNNWLVSVLQLMAEQYLISDDPMLIAKCQSTAIQVLALPAGREALEALGPDSHTHRHLRIYLPSSSTQQPAQQQLQLQGSKDGKGSDGGSAAEDLTAAVPERLWRVPSPAAGGADVWLRRLTPALLGIVSDPALRLMRDLAGLQPAVCEALFPALLQHLATVGAARDPCLPGSLGRQIQRHVLLPHQPLGQTRQAEAAQPDKALALALTVPGAAAPRSARGGDGDDPWVGGDLRAVQIILRSLEHLRQLHLKVVSGRKTNESSSKAAAVATVAGRDEWDAAVDGWEFVYGLEIDYLAVARAAIRCRQPATAMMYVGHWAEKAAGAVRVAHRLHADRQQATAAGKGSSTGGGGGGGSTRGRQQRGSSTSPPSSPTRDAPPAVAFENAAVQGGVHQALQVLPLCRPQPPDGTTEALSVTLDAYGAIDDPDALYALPSTYMLIGNGGAGGGGGGGGGGSEPRRCHPKGHDLEMRLFEREGLWPQALSGHDLELRPAFGRAYGTGAYGGGGGGGGGDGTAGQGTAAAAAAAVGIVSALRNLGGDVTAQVFLAGLASSAPGGFGVLPGGGGGGGAAAATAPLAELQYELSWRLASWSPVAAGHAVSSPLQPVGISAQAGLGAGEDGSSTVVGCSGAGGGGIHEAVYRSLAALAAGDVAQVESLLSAASHAAVCRFSAKIGPTGAASTSSSGSGEGATGGGGGAVSCLVDMRMLAALRDACQLAGSGGGAATAASSPAAAAALGMLLPKREAGGRGGGGDAAGDPWVSVESMDRASALEPLLALRCAALAAVGRPREQAAALVAVVAAARRTGATAAGLAAVQELKALLGRQAASAVWVSDLRCGGGAAWRLDEARLVRRRGQATLAANMALALVLELEQQQAAVGGGAVGTASASRGSSSGSAGGADGGCSLQLATALSLAGAWCAEAQVECGVYGGVMGLMGRAADVAVRALGGRMAGAGAGAGAGAAEGAGTASRESQAACKVLYRLAAYSDQRYREVVAVLQSPEHVKRMSVVVAKRREAEGIRAKKDAASGQMKQWLEAQLRRVLSPVLADEEADAALRSAQAALRTTAIANYGRCLCAGDRHDLAAVYRVCQMWLQPADGEDISAAFSQAAAAVPSYKWLPLVYQMASRLSTIPTPAGGGGAGGGAAGAAGDSFQRALQALLLRLATDHPYHAIYQLFALRNGNLDRAGRPQAATDTAGFVQVVDNSKMRAAEMLLQQLLGRGGRVAVIVKQAEKLVRMYIDLAALPPPQEDNPPPQPFPANLKRQVDGGAMDALPVVSSLIPVDPSAAYEGLPHLVSFDSTISYAGGINKPKIIVANDSSGAKHKQLVKSGNDDLRQDAVMQQTFALINGLLARDAAAARRGLRIATYRVVPFSPTAGLLQWVENTQPLNLYLLGKNYTGGAHGRYKSPGEWTWMQCYNHIRTAAEAGRKGGGVDAAELLLRAFEECCRRFGPVLHHFLLEAFPSPAAWLAAQAAYTRSTAAASMSGYLLGLGDRHSGNILLHGATGEVVHIDLGIAFEQGRFLVTPELVPFRLTRDLVDGMGINGVEGPFRRSCEETLRVLRSNAEMLLTVLEVVLHDPLHRWSLTLAKARQKQPRARAEKQQQQEQEQQHDDDDPVALLGNADAARAVLRVKQKLEGRLDAGGLGRASATQATAGGAAGGKAAAVAGATATGAVALAAAAAAAADAGGAPLNVEGQVRALLAEAQDPNRLSRMYVGWSPWM